ncbi:DNA repair protein rad18 [Hypoxylon sp. FL1284]|nr:DNA repair protein rad18 [Hypoxylon sp. FL1284]
MNDITILEQFDDVSDSTDWLKTPLPGLAAVEASLRCQVCKDFYKTPMLTSCNHTFCSICIRRALSNDGRCPLCRASEQEVKLRSNWSLEEVVAAFTKTRPDLLLFAMRNTDADSEAGSSKRKMDERDDMNAAGQPLGKRLRSSERLSKSKSMETTAEMACLEADPDGTPEQEEPPMYEPDDGLVECPICLQRMKHTLVNRHLDTSCPGEPQPRRQKSPTRTTTQQQQHPRALSTPATFPSSSAAPKQPPARVQERLPAINYSMLKEPQLKKRLAELGISAAGNRQMLERRHREWMTIWNANCDALRPRRRADLQRDLDVWERTLGSRAPAASKALAAGAHIRDKDFDPAAWALRHDASFKKLVATAQNTGKAGVGQASEDGKEGEDADGGGDGGGAGAGAEPEPQADTEMLASLDGSGDEEPREPVDRDRHAPRIIDLTGEPAPSDALGVALPSREGGAVDPDNPSRATPIP